MWTFTRAVLRRDGNRCLALTFRTPSITPGCTLNKQALLLTGCGSRNLAAVYAFGLNTEEAKRHLKEAVSSGEDRVAGPAAEALAWCEMEVRAPESAARVCPRTSPSFHPNVQRWSIAKLEG